MDRKPVNFLALLFIGIGAAIYIPATGWAQSFEDAYAAYRSAIEAGDFAAALPAAQQAYELGRVRLGRVNENVAALAMNYGRMVQVADTNDTLAAELFAEADAIYQELHGPDSLGRVEALMARGSVQSSHEDKHASIRAALRMHRTVLPDDDVAYARQLASGGELLAATGTDSPEARELLEDALATFEKELGKDSPELVSTLFALGIASANEGTSNRRQQRYFDRAVKIVAASNTDSSEAVADLELRIGLQLVQQTGGYADALPYVRSAHGRFEELFGSDNPRTAQAALTLGETYVATNENEAGVTHLENAIRYYEAKPEDRPNLIRARRALAALILVKGDDPLFDEQLTEMARLSAEMMTTLEYMPVVKYPPIHPREARTSRANGHVLVEFTVDEKGRIHDPMVIESRSGSGNGQVFHDAAIEAVEKYRYIPRFENGVAVSVPAVRDTIMFEFERNPAGPLPVLEGEAGIGIHGAN